MTATQPTTADELALRRAVLIDPADNVPRLVCADWLDDHDQQERAAMIRAAIRAYEINPADTWVFGRTQWMDTEANRRTEFGRLMIAVTAFTSDPDVNGLSLMEQDLAATNCLMWDRGFVEYVSLTLAAFFDYNLDLFERHPITSVRLTDKEPDGRSVWSASRDNNFIRQPGVLPWCVYDLLAGGGTPVGEGSRRQYPPQEWLYYRIYPTPDEAHADLSAACVRLGRNCVGLP